MTNPNDPSDIIAMKIGQLYVDINKKMKTEITNTLDRIKEEEEIRKLQELEELHNDTQKKIQQFENELKNAVQKAKDAEKQLMQQKK